MSSLLERLGERAADRSTDSEWIERALERSENELEDVPVDLHEPWTKTLAVLDRRREDVAEISHAGLVAVTVRLALGQDNEARVEWLLHQATFEEQDAALDAVDGRAIRSKEDRDAAWAKIKSVAFELLREVGPLVVSVLVALI